jgi:hypothetical protein
MQIWTVCGGPPVSAEASNFLRGLMQRPAARQLLRVLRRPMTAQWPTGRQPVIVCLQSSRAFFIPPPSPSPSRQALLALAADAPAPPPTLAGPAPVPELQVKAPTYTAKPFLQFPPLSPQARRRSPASPPPPRVFLRRFVTTSSSPSRSSSPTRCDAGTFAG